MMECLLHVIGWNGDIMYYFNTLVLPFRSFFACVVFIWKVVDTAIKYHNPDASFTVSVSNARGVGRCDTARTR